METQLIDQLIARFANKYPYKESPQPVQQVQPSLHQEQIPQPPHSMPQQLQPHQMPQQPPQPPPQPFQSQQFPTPPHTVQEQPQNSFEDTLTNLTRQMEMTQPKKSFFSSGLFFLLLKILLVLVIIGCCYFLFRKRK